LETTNEEIQSSNEELETINEELQSTNNELQSVNEEVRLRTEEYNRANNFLNAILLSLRGAIIVIDRDLKILAWSAKSEEMWGLRTEEVQDECLFNLDFGLPLEQIREPINRCLNEDQTQQDFVISAVNRRGKTFDCRLSIDALWNINKEKFGVIIIMQEVPSS
jgi:two-component system CheB/CheR fusion protein